MQGNDNRRREGIRDCNRLFHTPRNPTGHCQFAEINSRIQRFIVRAKYQSGNARFVLRQTESSPPIKAIRQIENEIGGFASLVARRNLLHAFRDINGLKPLYYAHRHNLTAFASERKALWRIGLKNAQAIHPGSVSTLTKKGITEKRLVQLPPPH